MSEKPTREEAKEMLAMFTAPHAVGDPDYSFNQQASIVYLRAYLAQMDKLETANSGLEVCGEKIDEQGKEVHELRAELERLREKNRSWTTYPISYDLQAVRDERLAEAEKLRARVAKLEKVRKAAGEVRDYWDVRNIAAFPVLGRKIDALRDALAACEPEPETEGGR